MNLQDQVSVWKTPHGMANLDVTGKRGGAGGGEFAKQANNWPTPDARVMNDGEGPQTWQKRQSELKARGINGNGAGMPLAIAGPLWTTPQSHDAGGGNQSE